MDLTKSILDIKIKEFEKDVEHDLTYREWIRMCEEHLEIEHANLDSMTDEELSRHDEWLLEVLDK